MAPNLSLYGRMLAALALTTGAALAQEPAASTPRIRDDYVAARAAVDSANARWCRAYEAHDVAGIMAVYANNPVALSGEGDVATDRTTLEASAEATMRYNPVKAQLTTSRFWLVDPSTAYEYGSYTLTFAPEVTDRVVFTERYVAEWRRNRAGEWKIRLKIGLPSE